MISSQMRILAILAALALAGCSLGSPLSSGANNYKGKPLSAVTTKLGQPNEVQTIAGQKAYIWNMGNAVYGCQIRVVMAGDVVDTYEGSGDVNICSQYGALSGGLKGYGE
jgi:FtsP/CotA-like multicopper oxidase with cupredoxin domain